MKVIEGKFGGKTKNKDDNIKTSEFLASFTAKAMDYEAEGKQVKVAVIMYEDGEVFEVASNEQYPDGVYMLLQLAGQAIINETLGIS
jgi:hypothetical protein|tara:strand:+ start:373 stop:633 length:261 start_codon:yes stop_codon:yes gene_type:complete